MKKGIALSGGGAKSFSQIGVLKVLEKKGFSFDVITGTSMGAIIGTIYSFTENAELLEEIIFKIFTNKEFKKIEKIFLRKNSINFCNKIWNNLEDFFLLITDTFKTGLFDSEIIRKEVYKYTGREIFFEEAKKTLGIIASEYFTGKTVIFYKGEIIPALIASSTIPGLIKPVRIKDNLYLDGGVTSTLPVIANYILGGEIIIGVENNSSLSEKSPLNAFDIFVQIEKIKSIYSSIFEGLVADYILKIEMPEIEWFNFSKIKECIKIGEEYTLKNLKFIEKALYKTEKASFKEEIVKNLREYYLLRESSRV